MLTATLILVVDLITEQLPAISLAYEPAERIIMQQPPRDRMTDHLVDARLMCYSFVFVALLESLCCVGAFILALTQRGITLESLMYDRAYWAQPPPEAASALSEGISAYFFTLVMCQACFHVYLAKTSRASVFTHGIFRNWLTVVGSVVAICVSVVAIFAMQGSFFGTAGMPQATSWFLCFAFLLVALPVTEAVKACARNSPRGCIARRIAW